MTNKKAQAYCLNCKEKVHFEPEELRPIKNKKTLLKGHCPTCNRIVTSFTSSQIPMKINQ